jgi:hypothetical protein
MEPCGAWWRIKEARRRSNDMSGRILAESEVVESYTLGTLRIPSFALFYDVLVYKMLWDRKKILNINLWRIIRLSMRPAIDMCAHISLERILVYTILV